MQVRQVSVVGGELKIGGGIVGQLLAVHLVPVVCGSVWVGGWVGTCRLCAGKNDEMDDNGWGGFLLCLFCTLGGGLFWQRVRQVVVVVQVTVVVGLLLLSRVRPLFGMASGAGGAWKKRGTVSSSSRRAGRTTQHGNAHASAPSLRPTGELSTTGRRAAQAMDGGGCGGWGVGAKMKRRRSLRLARPRRGQAAAFAPGTTWAAEGSEVFSLSCARTVH